MLQKTFFKHNNGNNKISKQPQINCSSKQMKTQNKKKKKMHHQVDHSVKQSTILAIYCMFHLLLPFFSVFFMVYHQLINVFMCLCACFFFCSMQKKHKLQTQLQHVKIFRTTVKTIYSRQNDIHPTIAKRLFQL